MAGSLQLKTNFQLPAGRLQKFSETGALSALLSIPLTYIDWSLVSVTNQIIIQLPAVRFHKFRETSALIALLSTTLTDILPNVLQLRLQCLDLFAKHSSDFLTNLLQLSGQGLMRSQGP